jgi:Fe-S-cluster containining protein
MGLPPGLPGSAFVPYPEEDRAILKAMPDEVLQDLLARIRALLDGDSPVWSDTIPHCVWFNPDTKRCRHYEHRPMICRGFAVGGEGCLRRRREEGIATPGPGRVSQ